MTSVIHWAGLYHEFHNMNMERFLLICVSVAKILLGWSCSRISFHIDRKRIVRMTAKTIHSQVKPHSACHLWPFANASCNQTLNLHLTVHYLYLLLRRKVGNNLQTIDVQWGSCLHTLLNLSIPHCSWLFGSFESRQSWNNHSSIFRLGTRLFSMTASLNKKLRGMVWGIPT